MSKIVKIIVGIIITLGLLAGIYLLFAQNKQPEKKQVPAQVATNGNGQSSLGANIEKGLNVQQNQNNQSPQQNQQNQQAQAPQQGQVVTNVAPVSETDKKISINNQWLDCKAGKISTSEELYWPVNIIEEIPVGGSYAKGYLIGDPNMVVQVYIKAGADSAAVFDQLVQGRTAFLKGNCTGGAPNGAAKLEAF